MAMRDDWLSQVIEKPIDPDREIVDPHHHLWDRNGTVYELDELWADTGCGHHVVQTVYIECHSAFRSDGPEHLKPVGETEYVAPELLPEGREAVHPELAARWDGEFDQVGVSYYRRWSTENFSGLSAVLKEVKTRHPETEVILVETAYPWTLDSV